MKRIIAILIAIFASVSVAKSQPKAVGLRAGMDCQFSYEHGMTGGRQGAVSSGDFIEVDLGV